MQIRTSGFDVQECPAAPLNDYLEYLSRNPIKSDQSQLYVVRREDFWVGLLLTIRDHRSFCKMQDNGGALTITVQQLASNENPVEFNVFLLRRATLKGIYLHYWHSRALTSFLSYLSHHYGAYKDMLAREEIEALRQEDYRTKKALQEEKKVIRERFKTKLGYRIWTKPESFRQMLARLASIKSLDIEIETVAVEEPNFRPLADLSKSIKQTYNFTSALTPVEQIRRAVIRSFDMLGGSLVNAKVKGVDPQGIEVIYSLANNTDYLSHHDFDETIANLQIDLNNVEQSLARSNLVNQLLGVTSSPKVSEILRTPQAL